LNKAGIDIKKILFRRMKHALARMPQQLCHGHRGYAHFLKEACVYWQTARVTKFSVRHAPLPEKYAFAEHFWLDSMSTLRPSA
jgi:hypothetical protein